MIKEKLTLKKIRDLKISAASGLVKRNDSFFVIADDELALSVFKENSSDEVTFPLLTGQLPEDHKERKKQKPDWESLCLLPAKGPFSEGLLAVPSGSTAHRTLGSYIALKNGILTKPRTIDFSNIYRALTSEFSELNIEGSVVENSKMTIFQRGNGLNNQSGFIELDLDGLYQDILNSGVLSETRILNSKKIDLGLLHGNSLGFTDACFIGPDERYFLAVAENSPNTYEDGEYQGAVLGCLNKLGQITSMQELDCPFKPEGLWIESQQDKKNIFIVTDADDRKVLAALYQAVLK